MKSKKQSRVDALNARVKNLTTLTIGMMETMKRMPGYKEAIEELKNENLHQVSEN